MNKISKHRLDLAKKNLEQFKNENLVAAMVTGSIAKGYGDDNSDIDTLLAFKKRITKKEFDAIVEGARKSGGDLYHGTPEEGFAVYYYFDGIKCDFGAGTAEETETLINEMLEKPEVDLVKHLMISGFIDGYDLYGHEWISKWRKKAEENFPKELQVMMVNQLKKFYPKWVIEKMAIERGDKLFYAECVNEIIGNMIGVFCGLNKKYHPGKLKGIEWSVEQLQFKPVDFIKRYNSVFDMDHQKAVDVLYELISETFDLIDKHLPEVSTERSRKL
ncbi:MAG: hypothetical protein IT281_08605, partial [Ignavibacteria bacterium]|nr:hypothetical protein [Ignavibacteria bacterium]